MTVFLFDLSKPSKKYVSKEIAKEIHTQAEKFLEWLKNAEEESSEEEEEEDDNVEVNLLSFLDMKCGISYLSNLVKFNRKA